MKLLTVFGYLKQKGHFLLLFSGLCCLVVTLSVISVSLSEIDKRYNDLVQEMAGVKKRVDSTHEQFVETMRRKRDVDESTRTDIKSADKGGAVYIRWGSTKCGGSGDSTELVYRGIAGGSHFTHIGAATNLQCLPNEPVWGKHTDTEGGAFIYGVEYEESFVGLIDMTNLKKPLSEHNVPCVVCRSKKRITSLMVPGKFDCFPGWHFEYHGYLMAGHHTHKAGTSYICVDRAPEADSAGYRNENGAGLYRVTAQCGSLPCPKYVHDWELACAVCTK